MSNPQPDKFFKFSTELFEAMCRFRIPGEVRQVLDTIIRKTYGWHKKDDRISLSQFVEATGLSKSNTARALSKAITHNIIIRSDNNSYSINKDYNTWIPFIIRSDNARYQK